MLKFFDKHFKSLLMRGYFILGYDFNVVSVYYIDYIILAAIGTYGLCCFWTAFTGRDPNNDKPLKFWMRLSYGVVGSMCIGVYWVLSYTPKK